MVRWDLKQATGGNQGIKRKRILEAAGVLIFVLVLYAGIRQQYYDLPAEVEYAELSVNKVEAPIYGKKSDRAVLYLEDGAVLIDGEGNHVSEIYDEIYDELDKYEPYIRYVSEGEIGYLDAVSGEIAIPAQYKEASLMDKTAVVGNGKFAWYISREGERLSENYEEAYSFEERQNTYARVKKEGKWGMISSKFKEVLPCQYDYINELPLVDCLATGVKNGSAYIINMEKEPFWQKQVAEECDIEAMYDLYGYTFVTGQNGRKGVVDCFGEIVLDNVKLVDERTIEGTKCWCVQLCDRENSRWFIRFQSGKPELCIPLPDGAYCSDFCDLSYIIEQEASHESNHNRNVP